MTDNYSQYIEVALDKSARIKQVICFCLFLIAIALLAVAATVNWYIVFAGVVVGYIGGVYLHLYNKTAKQYIYNFTTERLVISKTDVANRTKRMVSVVWQDVNLFEILADANEIDVIAASSVGNKGVYVIEYAENDIIKRLCFEPDEYMVVLIKEILLDTRKINNNAENNLS